MRNLIQYYILLFVAITFSTYAQIKVGDKIPSVLLKSSNDKEINIASINGKYLLIDFWASWCAPCRAGNKKLVKLYNQLDTTKFEIIGISIDKDPTKWENAILKDKIKYLQLIEPNGFEAKSAVLFGVEALPSKFLFNKEGILISINPSEEELNKIIKNEK